RREPGRASVYPRSMFLPFLLACVCNCLDTVPERTVEGDTLPALAPPEAAAVGDELVLDLVATPAGDWADEDAPGALVEVTAGGNVRHLVLPGGAGAVTQSVSLGAWDGGALAVAVIDGDVASWDRAAVRVDPTAAGTPVLGTYDAAWSNDTALVVYEEGGLWTWVFTDEDGGTGLLPTLLLARWGRPVDIEGLWDEGTATIQTHDHAWVPFDGPYEGAHPLLQVVTYNGLVGPLDDAPYLLSPVPVAFAPDGLQRERVLDAEAWVLAAAWAEAGREDLVVPDGGPEDNLLGAPDDYLFVDYVVAGGARVAFEVEVDGTWWSSINSLSDGDGLTDARVSGIGRTCVELPPGAGPDDVTALRIRSYTDGGTVDARWFRYDADLHPVEVASFSDVPFDPGGTANFF
ncbi:MAG: hypothetical protein ACK4YP_14375, partial [Myxococcota bacterium]